MGLLFIFPLCKFNSDRYFQFKKVLWKKLLGFYFTQWKIHYRPQNFPPNLDKFPPLGWMQTVAATAKAWPPSLIPSSTHPIFCSSGTKLKVNKIMYIADFKTQHHLLWLGYNEHIYLKNTETYLPMLHMSNNCSVKLPLESTLQHFQATSNSFLNILVRNLNIWCTHQSPMILFE